MKNFTLFCTLMLVAIFTTAQNELSLVMGIHPYGKIYDMTSGNHLAIQYDLATDKPIRYGMIAQHSRFSDGQNIKTFNANTPAVTSLNAFAAATFIKTNKMRSYVKMEIGGSYASTKPVLESRASFNIASHFVAAQFNPAIGAEWNINNMFNMHVEYKNIMHYGHINTVNGSYNYGSLDLGITYRFGQHKYNKRPYGYTKCRTNKRTSVSSCYSFR